MQKCNRIQCTTHTHIDHTHAHRTKVEWKKINKRNKIKTKTNDKLWRNACRRRMQRKWRKFTAGTQSVFNFLLFVVDVVTVVVLRRCCLAHIDLCVYSIKWNSLTMYAWIISSILSIAIYIYICRNTLDFFFSFFFRFSIAYLHRVWKQNNTFTFTSTALNIWTAQHRSETTSKRRRRRRRNYYKFYQQNFCYKTISHAKVCTIYFYL